MHPSIFHLFLTTPCNDVGRLQCRIPTFVILPGMTRRMITKPDGSLLNTCTSDAIIQILRFLKRAFWPFAWDSSQGLAADSRGLGTGGGFAAAAKAMHLLSLAAAHAPQMCQAGYTLVPTAATRLQSQMPCAGAARVRHLQF